MNFTQIRFGTMACAILLGAAASSQAAPVKAGPKVFGVAIYVSDVQRSEKFYKEIFGLTEVMRNSSPDGQPREIVLSLSGKLNQGAALVIAQANAEQHLKGSETFGRVILTVPDAHALAERVKSAGFAVVMSVEPKQPSVAAVVVFVKDPDGYTVELFQPSVKTQ